MHFALNPRCSMLQTEGFVLSVSGFNDKLHLLLSKIVDMIFSLTVSSHPFPSSSLLPSCDACVFASACTSSVLRRPVRDVS